MSGIVLSVTLMTNQVATGPILGELDPYNAAITCLIDSNTMPAGTNVVYLTYYKFTVSFQDFGTARNAANKTPQLPVCCTIKGIFIAVTKSGNQQYTAGENSEYGYLYGTALARLLEDYATEASMVTFAISHHMEERPVVKDKLLAQNHNLVMYPANHTDLHLGDVLFYNMAAQLRKLKIARHTYAYSEVNLGLNLFPENVVALFFHRIMQFEFVPGAPLQIQSPPPRHLPLTPPLQGITRAEHTIALVEFQAPAQGIMLAPFNQQPTLKSIRPPPSPLRPSPYPP